MAHKAAYTCRLPSSSPQGFGHDSAQKLRCPLGGALKDLDVCQGSTPLGPFRDGRGICDKPIMLQKLLLGFQDGRGICDKPIMLQKLLLDGQV
jgi:hypothetical protein